MSWIITPSFYGFITDADAKDYLERVHAAEGQTLEPAVALAIESFVVGCKADGIWSAIKASCILAGARTLDGALVPLVGAAPTNNNFVAGDYNRETGLVGDGSTKYLDSNFAANAIAQDNRHSSCFATEAGNSGSNYLSVNGAATAYNSINPQSPSMRFGTSTALSDFITFGSFTATNFIGWSRQISASATVRVGGSSVTSAAASVSPPASNWFCFCRNNSGTPSQFSNARLAFYSIGESLDLALLDARVTTLMSDLAAAIV